MEIETNKLCLEIRKRAKEELLKFEGRVLTDEIAEEIRIILDDLTSKIEEEFLRGEHE